MHVIIIGAGPAGISAAGMITDLDRKVECTVLTAENQPPYSPPVMYDHFINGLTSSGRVKHLIILLSVQILQQ